MPNKSGSRLQFTEAELDGGHLKESTRKTMDTVYRLIDLNKDLADKKRGILVEKYLNEL